MGILQGDSPTPGPAMYWQPYHTEETALRARPLMATGDDMSIQNNNNNIIESDTKMIQHQQSMTSLDTPTSFFNYHHHYHSIKEENRENDCVRSTKDTSSIINPPSSKAQEPSECATATTTTSATGGSNTAAAICAGCNFKIADRYYLVAVDKAWHSECLRCDECRRPLDTALSCFARQSRIYCREDYNRLFGGRKQCAKCCETLQSDELVMRGREHLFHTRCFSCHVCQTHLVKGSTFGMVGALIFCQQHYQSSLNQQQQYSASGHSYNNQQQQATENSYGMTAHQQQQQPFGSPTHHYDHLQQQQQHYGQAEPMDTKMYGSPAASASPASAKRARTKRRPSAKSDMVAIMNEREDDSFMSVDGVGMMDTSSPPNMLSGCVGSMMGGQQQMLPQQQQQQKTKRLRTSFKHHQLRMLKSYFATNHNPDAKDLKQLSQKTTLSKRVLQVWFQNARAKWRRLVQKNENGQPGANNGNTGGSSSVSGHNMSSSGSSTSSNCSGSGNETGSPVPTSSISPSHARPHLGHHQPQHQGVMMASFMDQSGHMMTSHSRMSLYDEISMSGSSVASVGFPSPL